ncbi:MAG: pyridoxal phosphate-dependent aminotransferase [Eubacterium sp.]|nr:pyridoxal phosphate-dependent aminotransferase [Eubacterium sp.]
MQISKRIQGMGEPALLKYYPLVSKAEARGTKVYYLNIGQPDITTPPSFMEKVNAMKNDVLAYAEPEGETALRQEAVKYYSKYGFDYGVDDMLITNGGSEALLFTFLTICNPGDEIVTPEPLYSIYKEMASACSVGLRGIMTYTEEGFALPDKKAIEAVITPATKAILITNPGNPTGKVYTKEEIERLRDIALAHNLYIITDEVYREFIYDGLSYTSPGHYPELAENCIIIDSISKRYSACGARIGFILSKNHSFMEQVRKLCQMRLAVSSVDQLGAAELFKLDTGFFDDVLKEYTHRRDIVYDCLKNIDGVIFKKPTGAFYYVVKLPVLNACDFIEWMITDFEYQGATVLLSPANDFYIHPEDGVDEVRLAYVLKDSDMKQAMEVLGRGLAEYRSRFPEKSR